MSTSLIEALDFHWNHQNDWLYAINWNQLSVREKINKIMADVAVYAFASFLGMNNLEKCANRRISQKDYADYHHYISKDRVAYNQSVILVLTGAEDIAISPNVFKSLKKQSGCKLAFRAVSKLEDIKNHIDDLKKANNKIQALWIRAHGAPQAIYFNKTALINIAPLNEWEAWIQPTRIESARALFSGCLKKLEEEASIILESCHTGKKMDGGAKNMAQFIAAEAEGRKVYAPSREMLPIDSFAWEDNKNLKVAMKSFQNCTSYAKESCLARMSAIWHAFCSHEEEITCQF